MREAIISVHTPKVAGTSFLCQLKRLYGEDQILMDYNDDPVNVFSTANIDPGAYDAVPVTTIAPYKVVHGHFMPKKYARVGNAFRLTFLRHPAENVTSIYNYWMSSDISRWESPIFKYAKRENLSLERFAALPKIRYLYTKSYFSDFDMTKFDFIGDYAFYDSELARLGELLSLQFDPGIKLNETPYQGNAKETAPDNTPLREILKDDIDFYEAFKGR